MTAWTTGVQMLPLEGLTVIAVEQAVAAPFCSSRLADAGAHVIKVERPEGDFARGYADRKAYVLWIQAESALASVTGTADGPSRVGLSIVDIATGATAHAAILEALIGRGRTGKGADIRISMFDVMADLLTVPLLNSEAGNPPQRMGLAHPSIAPYGVFSSKDGKDILISIQSEREWKKLCADVLGQPALPDDPRLCNMVERVRNRELTDRIVGEVFGALTRDELLQ